LAEMLGVRRTSVSGVAANLQEKGMILYNRGKIHIKDVAALRETSCECYATVKKHYRDLLGND
jgi:Mn-dependent DtxR family transcriptional regulator